MSISCIEFRQIVGAVPDSRAENLFAHRAECRACADYAQAQIALDRRLQAALRVPVPEDLKARVIWNQTSHGSRPWRRPAVAWTSVGLAAGLALAVALGVLLTRIPGETLQPAEVIAHIEHEPELLAPTDALAEPVRVNAVLNRGGARLDPPLDNVVHAGLCPFRGRLVPHLVVRVDGEPVSVLLLPDERIAAPQEFSEDGYEGLLVPRAGGSVAIVAPRPELVRPVRRQLEDALQWTI